MKRLVEEVAGGGMESLLGQRVTIFCCRYIYEGKLVGVNSDCVELADCGIVYETGPLDASTRTDYQKLPGNWFVARGAIESYGLLKCK